MEDLINNTQLIYDDRSPIVQNLPEITTPDDRSRSPPLPPAPAENPVTPNTPIYGSAHTKIRTLPPSRKEASDDFTPKLPPRPGNSIHPSRRAAASTLKQPSPPTSVTSSRATNEDKVTENQLELTTSVSESVSTVTTNNSSSVSHRPPPLDLAFPVKDGRTSRLPTAPQESIEAKARGSIAAETVEGIEHNYPMPDESSSTDNNIKSGDEASPNTPDTGLPFETPATTPTKEEPLEG